MSEGLLELREGRVISCSLMIEWLIIGTLVKYEKDFGVIKL